MKRVYLDYAASTPVDKRVLTAMAPYYNERFANAGSAHWFGQQAAAGIFEAREKLARAINTTYEQIIFTGSATEANNLAIQGLLRQLRGGAFKIDGKPRIIISAIEHQSVLKLAEELARQEEIDLVYLPVNHAGVVEISKLKNLLNERTVLVSVMLANSEIGTIQPIGKIAKIISDFRDSCFRGNDTGGSNKSNNVVYPLFHTDAVQGLQYLKCDVEELGVDMMTLSAHKIYGPKGVGALYVKNRSWLKPIIMGGEREWGLRGGTESTATIVGFGVAAAINEKMRAAETERVLELRDHFWKEFKKILPKAQLNGSLKDRLPHNLNIYFPGWPSQDLAIELDLMGVSASVGSACVAKVAESSYVVEALGYKDDRATSSLRFTLGRPTKKSDVDFVLEVFKKRFE